MTKKRVYLVAVTVIILLLCVVATLFTSKGSTNYIDNLISKYNIEGASVAVIEKGEVVDVRNYGYANVEGKVKVDEFTQFKIASISKTVTAYAIMNLVDEGKLDLDKPINTYLKKWKLPNTKFNEDKVTLRTLMSHTSGITDSSEYGYNYPIPTIEKALKDRDIKLKREPGEMFQYSSFSGFGICQLVIEEVTGEKFEDYMASKVFSKLNMNLTNYSNISEGRGLLATPYAGHNKPVKVTPIAMTGAGGVTTTSGDLAKFVIELMRYYNNIGGEMFQVQHNTKSTSGEYGLGIIPRKLSNGTIAYEHNGTLTGWNAQIVFEPLKGNGIVILTNSDKAFHLMYDVMENWSENVFGEEIIDRQINRIVEYVNIAILALFLVIIIILSIFVYNIKNKKLNKLEKRSMYIRITILSLIMLGLACAYFILLYTDIPFKALFNMSNYYVFTFLPPRLVLVNVEIVLIMLIIIIRSRYTKGLKGKRNDSSRN